MNLGMRVRRLEARNGGLVVVYADGFPSFEQRRDIAERYRREDGLAPHVPIAVFDQVETNL